MPSEHETIHIAYCTDEHYLLPLAVSIQSILRSFKTDASLAIHIIHQGVSAQDQQKLQDMCEGTAATLDWIAPDIRAWQQTVTANEFAIATFFRLLLGDVLPESVHKVIYLDGDLICLQDISTLWQTPLEGHIAAAVQHPHMQCIGTLFSNAFCSTLHVMPEQPYFNAGVLVIDLDQWRAHDIGRMTLQLAQQYGPYFIHPDQDPLNVVLAGNWLMLHPNWNRVSSSFVMPFSLMPYAAHDENEMTDPAIVHFTDAIKPWHASCLHPYCKTWNILLQETLKTEALRLLDLTSLRKQKSSFAARMYRARQLYFIAVDLYRIHGKPTIFLPYILRDLWGNAFAHVAALYCIFTRRGKRKYF